jgi:hypothetical protein
MKKMITAALMCLLASASFAQNLTKETRNVSSFTGIDASSAFSIELKKGATQSVVIECESSYIPNVKTEVKGGVLRIYYSNPARNARMNNSSFKAYITMNRELDFLDLSGASSITTTDLFTPARFKADLSGASRVNGLHIRAADAKIDLSGASTITMEVNFDRASVDLSGASKSNINGTIKQAIIDVSGASRVNHNIKSDRVQIGASGASNITLEGEANQVKASLSAAASLSAEKFVVQEMDISISGAGRANVHVTGTLRPNLSSGSLLNYQGSPQISNLKVSSGASINGK